jgi:KaiC/GvpD/RAD55 family RecA-like ATPase
LTIPLKRVHTGVVGLDEMLHGGLPHGAWVLVIGPPGSGKSTLGRQFLYTASEKKSDAVLLSTSDSQENIFQSMWAFGWEPKTTRGVRIIDSYSWKKGTPSPIDPRRLTEVSIAMPEFFDNAESKTGNICFVIDSFTDFLLNNEPDAAIRFLSQLKGKLQTRNITTLVLLEDGPHPVNVTSAVEYLTDGTIRTKYDETGRYIMVSRMIATPVQLGWSEFKIQKGIDIVVKSFFGGGGR